MDKLTVYASNSSDESVFESPEKPYKSIEASSDVECQKIIAEMLQNKEATGSDLVINYTGRESRDELIRTLFKFPVSEEDRAEAEKTILANSSSNAQSAGNGRILTTKVILADMACEKNIPKNVDIDQKPDLVEHQLTNSAVEAEALYRGLVEQLKEVEGFDSEEWGAGVNTKSESKFYKSSTPETKEEKEAAYKEFLNSSPIPGEKCNNKLNHNDKVTFVDYNSKYFYEGTLGQEQADGQGGMEYETFGDQFLSENEFDNLDISKLPDEAITSSFVLDYVLRSVPPDMYKAYSADIDMADSMANLESQNVEMGKSDVLNEGIICANSFGSEFQDNSSQNHELPRNEVANDSQSPKTDVIQQRTPDLDKFNESPDNHDETNTKASDILDDKEKFTQNNEDQNLEEFDIDQKQSTEMVDNSQDQAVIVTPLQRDQNDTEILGPGNTEISWSQTCSSIAKTNNDSPTHVILKECKVVLVRLKSSSRTDKNGVETATTYVKSSDQVVTALTKHNLKSEDEPIVNLTSVVPETELSPKVDAASIESSVSVLTCEQPASSPAFDSSKKSISSISSSSTNIHHKPAKNTNAANITSSMTDLALKIKDKFLQWKSRKTSQEKLSSHEKSNADECDNSRAKKTQDVMAEGNQESEQETLVMEAEPTPKTFENIAHESDLPVSIPECSFSEKSIPVAETLSDPDPVAENVELTVVVPTKNDMGIIIGAGQSIGQDAVKIEKPVGDPTNSADSGTRNNKPESEHASLSPFPILSKTKSSTRTSTRKRCISNSSSSLSYFLPYKMMKSASSQPNKSNNRSNNNRSPAVRLTEELTKTEPDLEIVSTLFGETFSARKKYMDSNPDADIAAIVKKYPALKIYQMVKEEYGRAINPKEPGKIKMEDLEEKLKESLLKIFTPKKKRILRKKHKIWEDTIARWNSNKECDQKTKQVLQMIALCFHFAEDKVVSTLCQILDENEVVSLDKAKRLVTPTIVLKKPQLFECNTEIWIYIEAKKYLKVPNFYEAVLCVYAIYYVFNLQYHKELQNLFHYFDSVVGLSEDEDTPKDTASEFIR